MSDLYPSAQWDQIMDYVEVPATVVEFFLGRGTIIWPQPAARKIGSVAMGSRCTLTHTLTVP